jgi:hypothetical protein
VRKVVLISAAVIAGSALLVQLVTARIHPTITHAAQPFQLDPLPVPADTYSAWYDPAPALNVQTDGEELICRGASGRELWRAPACGIREAPLQAGGQILLLTTLASNGLPPNFHEPQLALYSAQGKLLQHRTLRSCHNSALVLGDRFLIGLEGQGLFLVSRTNWQRVAGFPLDSY